MADVQAAWFGRQFATFSIGRLSRMTVMHEGQVLSDLMAADIGNSRVKLGQFQCECSDENNASKGVRTTDDPLLPEPVATFDLPIRHDTGKFDSNRLVAWCNEHLASGTSWRIASVHRAAAARLSDVLSEWATQSKRDCPIRQLTYRDVPITIRVDE